MNLYKLAGVLLPAFALLSVSCVETGKIEGAATQEPAALSGTPEKRETPPTSTASPTKAARKAVELGEHAFVSRQNRYDDKYHHEWFVMVTNPTNQVAEGVRVQASFYSDDGTVLGTEDAYVYVWPGQTLPATSGFATPLSSQASRMEVRVASPGRFRDVKTQNFPTVADVEVVKDRYFGEVRGKAKSPWSTSVETMQVICVLRGPANEVVGVETSYLDLLQGDATSVVSCEYISSDALNEADTAKMFLALTSISTVIDD